MLMKLPLWSEKCHLESDNGYQRTLLFNLESLSVDIGIGACVTFAMICLFHDDINNPWKYMAVVELLLSYNRRVMPYLPYVVFGRKQTLLAHYTCCYPHPRLTLPQITCERNCLYKRNLVWKNDICCNLSFLIAFQLNWAPWHHLRH